MARGDNIMIRWNKDDSNEPPDYISVLSFNTILYPFYHKTHRKYDSLKDSLFYDKCSN